MSHTTIPLLIGFWRSIKLEKERNFKVTGEAVWKRECEKSMKTESEEEWGKEYLRL